jgi:two-component system cell cycle sensor histidine kinase/response regulator CckA
MTMTLPISVIHLEDDPADAELVREILLANGLRIDVDAVDNRDDFIAALDRRIPDIILSDYNLPSFDGLAALALAQQVHPEVPFIFVSGTIGEDRAVDVLNNGATDYVLKTQLTKLPLALRRALSAADERRRGREAEQLLRVSEEQYRRLVEEIPGFFFMARFQDGRASASFVSPQVERMVGYTPGEWLSDPELSWSRVHADDRVRVARELERCIREGNQVDFEHRFLHRDGRTVWVRVGVKPEGSGRGDLRGIVTDITERKRMEEQFLQAQKMEAVGRLAGGVAHDFNNLLTVINGYSELLLGSLPPGAPARADLEEIFNAGKRAASLTRQLLAFSRKQVTQPASVDLNVLVSSLRKMLERLVGEDVKIAFAPGADLDLVMADPGQIEQVIVNLVVNARDAMPRGGKIAIETGNALLDEAYAALHPDMNPGAHVRLTVADAGVGMTDEVKAHLFEPFFTTKEKGKGTGLGLSTVHGIVKHAGGAIEVESEVGRGTRFRIYIPRAGSGGQVVAPVPPVRNSKGTETILVAEDQETVRRLAKVVLEAAGYRVLMAADGTEALRLAESHEGPIHLLLTDMVMRSMSGAELAKLVRREHPETRVLFISGYAERGLEEIGAAAAFLQKPFTLEGLRGKVREVLDAPAGGLS